MQNEPNLYRLRDIESQILQFEKTLKNITASAKRDELIRLSGFLHKRLVENYGVHVLVEDEKQQLFWIDATNLNSLLYDFDDYKIIDNFGFGNCPIERYTCQELEELAEKIEK